MSVVVNAAPSSPHLARLPGVVDPDGRSGDRRRGVLQHPQSFLFGDARLDAPENPDRIALLETIERARRRRPLDVRERRDGDEPALGVFDLEIQQRRNRGPVRVADLRMTL